MLHPLLFVFSTSILTQSLPDFNPLLTGRGFSILDFGDSILDFAAASDMRYAICDMRYAICDMRYAICDKIERFPSNPKHNDRFNASKQPVVPIGTDLNF
ncbi:hypothetical protein SAMN05444359_10979 [Neolewinella agarilytica]|uniref:Uncharacterized protein n=1 Tax=Neolewinella agarilytica TaxID=478744 RepID=A0A1H9FRX5_9BACT|nr:hypothetical protein SAMN05444359_10979 [Neolewinella agarilytica]